MILIIRTAAILMMIWTCQSDGQRQVLQAREVCVENCGAKAGDGAFRCVDRCLR